MMDDFAEKIRDLLSDEESMNQFRTLYEAVSGTGHTGYENSSDSGKSDNCEDFTFDPETFIKLQSVIGNAGNRDDGTALITALRPHLKDERKEKADKAIKMLNIINMVSVLKESGLLNDLI